MYNVDQKSNNNNNTAIFRINLIDEGNDESM